MAESNREPTLPPAEPAASIVVWILPARVIHWTLATAVLVAYFTANIYDTVHEIAGYTALGLLILRVGLGLFGPRLARFTNLPLRPRAVIAYLGALARGKPRGYAGHNPAGAAMVVTLLLVLSISTITGWMQITERWFGIAWVQDLHTYASHLMFALAVVHILAVLLMCYLLRENLVAAMITGRKRIAPPR